MSDDPIGDRIVSANPVPYAHADTDDVVAVFLGHTVAGRYTNNGEFHITLAIPYDILNPHDLMGTMTQMVYVEMRKC